jgi:outer membrane murein-binding lipoprotein Lpp
MQFRQTHRALRPLTGPAAAGPVAAGPMAASPARTGTVCAGAVVIVAVLALAGCSNAAKAKSVTSVQTCGTSRTAANVPVQVEVYRGQVSCTVAISVAKNYAAAVVAGRAPGNGGGGPVTVNGWKCQGFPTPQLLKTGDASKCVKDGAEILEILKTPS